MRRKKTAGTEEGAALRDPNINLDGTMPIIKDPSKFPKLKMLVTVPAGRLMPTGEVEMVKRLTSITGVEFEWIEIPEAGAEEKINLMLASGTDLPDAFWSGVTPAIVSNYIGQDVFRSTGDLQEKYMPRLQAIYQKRPLIKPQATYPDDHLYGFPWYEELKGLVLTPGPFLINTEWLKKVGKKMPATVDEFADVLRAFRDGGDLNGNGKADEIPYALDFTARDRCGTYNSFHQFTAAFGQADSYCGYNPVFDHMLVINDKIVFTARDPAYKDTAKFFHTLYKEKLLDIDSFTPGPSSTYPLYLNKTQGTEARLGVMAVWSPLAEIPNETIRNQYQPIPRLTGPKGKTGFIPNFSEMQQPSMVTITAACKYPEVIAAFVDYCYEPEISYQINWGATGFSCEKGADGKLHFLMDEKGNYKVFPPYKTFTDLRYNSSPMRGAIIILNEYFDTVGDFTPSSSLVIDYQTINGKYEILDEYTAVPRMLMTNDEQASVARIQTTISDIVRRYTIQWVLDGNADATWDAYLAELKAAGVEDLLKLMQGAYDRLLKAK